MSKLLSIIIPVYNVELYLDECLKSVFEQVTDDIEVIVINDGSTDSSSKIIENYQDKYLFKYINQQNKGISITRNVGINEASGQYISFLDSDDIFADGIINKIVKEIITSKLDLYKLKYTKFIDGEDIDKSNTLIGSNLIMSKYEVIEDNNFYCWLYIFNCKLFDGFEFDYGRCYEDQLILPSIIYQASTCKLINDIIVYYRVRSSSITHTVSLSYVDDAFFGLERYSNEYKKDSFYFSKILAEQYISFLSKCARADHLDHAHIVNMMKKANKLISISMIINSKNTKAIIFRMFSKLVFYRLRMVTKKDYY